MKKYIAPETQIEKIDIRPYMTPASPASENVHFDPTQQVSGGLGKSRDEDYESDGWSDGLW